MLHDWLIFRSEESSHTWGPETALCPVALLWQWQIDWYFISRFLWLHCNSAIISSSWWNPQGERHTWSSNMNGQLLYRGSLSARLKERVDLFKPFIQVNNWISTVCDRDILATVTVTRGSRRTVAFPFQRSMSGIILHLLQLMLISVISVRYYSV